MSIQFAENTGSKPSAAELASFASRANEINIGGDDIVELGDDLGMNLMANPNKVTATPSRQVSFGPPTTDAPKIQIKPVDDLEVVNLDAAPGNNEIQFKKSSDAPFVIQTSPSPPHVDNLEQENVEKQKYLTKLRRLEAQDIRGARMTMANSLTDIKAEHDRLTDSRNLESSVRFQRNALMTFVTGVEMVNDKFGNRLPVKPRLKGWSESVHTNIEDFDEIFEELYDLYKDTAKVHPIIRLVGTLGVSATMYHLTNTMAERSGIPGMADLLHENPELQRQFAAAAAAKMGGGFGNFMNAASGFAQPRAPTQVPFNVSAAAMDEVGQGQARREMRGPTGVDDILKAFEAERMAQPPIQPTSNVFAPVGPPPTPPRLVREGVGTRADPLSEFALGSDAQSVGTDTTMNTEKRRGRRRAVAPQVGATLNLNV